MYTIKRISIIAALTCLSLQVFAQTYTPDWERKAIAGDATAQNVLGNCYLNGDGVPKNEIKAFEWYQKAAEQGNAFAQFNLGSCYYNGQGTPINYQLAVEWYKKAAEQDIAMAQNALGECYRDGEGVTRDYEAAVDMFDLAAEKDYYPAQYNLGACYYYGFGVEKDEEAAKEWLEKSYETAADNGVDFTYAVDMIEKIQNESFKMPPQPYIMNNVLRNFIKNLNYWLAGDESQKDNLLLTLQNCDINDALTEVISAQEKILGSQVTPEIYLDYLKKQCKPGNPVKIESINHKELNESGMKIIAVILKFTGGFNMTTVNNFVVEGNGLSKIFTNINENSKLKRNK